jgi:LuxR family transcriptional regulator, quorum-sensing system regulator SinR
VIRSEAAKANPSELPHNDTAVPSAFFEALRRDYALANCAYLDLMIEPGSQRRARAFHTRHPVALDQRADGATYRVLHALHTYDIGWERLYRARDYQCIDPVFQAAVTGLAPVDWAQARAAAPFSASFYRQAARAGIGSRGIVIPLVAHGNRRAFLSLEASHELADWPGYRDRHLSAWLLAASRFHAAFQAAEAERRQARAERLTPRETEVLRWVAGGKSYWEIAIILGITERTVRHFMTNVRSKLDAVSNSQAVAIAAHRRLIDA